MLCRIADLNVEVPEAGGMASRCKDYLWSKEAAADIIIRSSLYRRGPYPEEADDEFVAYMESAVQFFIQLLAYDGLYLHASAVELDGRAYLFSADSGIGKSTHARMWGEIFGDGVRVFNDDKPALRRLDDRWYAYGLPWCGKDGININLKVPLAGICFLKRSDHNSILRLTNEQAVSRIIPQSIKRVTKVESLDLMLSGIDRLVRDIPIFELENRPEPAAALLSYEAMRQAAEEVGL